MFVFICIFQGKHKNRWRDSSAENRVIGDYEVEEWKDVGMYKSQNPFQILKILN